MSFRFVGLFVVAVSAAACAGKTTAGDPAAPEQQAGAAREGANRNRDLITQEELSAPDTRSRTVMEVIRSKRPHFLIERGMNAHSDDEAGKVHVSIDNGRILPLSELETIHAGSVIEVRYMNPAQAMQKFGGAAREGPVIVVRTIK